MSLSFVKKLVEVLVKRERLLDKVNQDSLNTANYNEIISLNQELIDLKSECSIADIGRHYSFLQGVARSETDAITKFMGLAESLEENDVSAFISILEKTTNFLKDVLRYIGGRTKEETKLRILKSIENKDFDLADYIAQRHFFESSETQSIQELIYLLKSNDVTGAIDNLRTQKINEIFNPKEIEFIRKLIGEQEAEKRREKIQAMEADNGPLLIKEIPITSKPTWRVIGYSVHGADHIRWGIPNEDAIMALAGKDGYGPPIALALADGISTATRSKIGARIAVEVAIGLLDNILHETDQMVIKDYIENGLIDSIINEWRGRVNDHFRLNPYATGEVEDYHSRVSAPQDVNRHIDRDKNKPVSAYKCNLASVLVTESFIVYLKVGDCGIYTVTKEGEVIKPLPEVELPENANQEATYDILDKESYRFLFESISTHPEFIMVTSDSLIKTVTPPETWFGSASEIIKKEGIDEVNKLLPQWLKYHVKPYKDKPRGDDTTLGIICNLESLTPTEEPQRVTKPITVEITKVEDSPDNPNHKIITFKVNDSTLKYEKYWASALVEKYGNPVPLKIKDKEQIIDVTAYINPNTPYPIEFVPEYNNLDVGVYSVTIRVTPLDEQSNMLPERYEGQTTVAVASGNLIFDGLTQDYTALINKLRPLESLDSDNFKMLWDEAQDFHKSMSNFEATLSPSVPEQKKFIDILESYWNDIKSEFSRLGVV